MVKIIGFYTCLLYIYITKHQINIMNLDRTINDLSDFIEYCIQELEINNLNELYPTEEEKLNFVENSEQQFNTKYKPAIEAGQKLYF